MITRLFLIITFLVISVQAQIKLNFTIHNHTEIFPSDSLKGVKKVVKKECEFIDSIHRECEIVERNYNEKGFLTSEIEFNKEGKINKKKVYEYNERNKLVLFEEYDEDGVINDKEEYKYDDMFRLTDLKDYDNDGKVQRELSCFYDPISGFLKKTMQFDDSGKLEKTNEYSDYDLKTKSYKETSFDPNQKVLKITTKVYEIYEE